ncbi:TatD family hydrolase [Pseudopedobacter beijingensis]|uniref:TatD family hydrolase n=1 Tax=Pseudopedobacter beijingensis TaxID=1207056 RepID=A0ABW4IFH2_9SPHI
MIFPTEKHFINIHTHRKPHSADEWVLRNAFHKLTPEQITKLSYPVSVGIHPWYVHEKFEEVISHIESVLSVDNVLAIGEIGLDRAVNVGLELQKIVFELQLQLAVQYKKPVIIHTVKSNPDLIFYIKKYKIPFILHQYRGNEVQTLQFLKFDNVYFSFGKDLVSHQKILNSFSQIPLNRIFLETDTSRLPIENIYTFFADFKKMKLLDLQLLMYQNLKNVFQF